MTNLLTEAIESAKAAGAGEPTGKWNDHAFWEGDTRDIDVHDGGFYYAHVVGDELKKIRVVRVAVRERLRIIMQIYVLPSDVGKVWQEWRAKVESEATNETA